MAPVLKPKRPSKNVASYAVAVPADAGKCLTSLMSSPTAITKFAPYWWIRCVVFTGVELFAGNGRLRSRSILVDEAFFGTVPFVGNGRLT